MATITFSMRRVPCDETPLCLAWHGGDPIDPTAGRRYGADGPTPLGYLADFGFDRATSCTTSDCAYLVLVQNRGTKGVILKNLQPLREINRSFVRSHALDYAFAIVALPNGRPGLVHCPNDANRLEIEDLETGQRLMRWRGPVPDYLLARLTASPDGRSLCDQGLLWQQTEAGFHVDVTRALIDKGYMQDLRAREFQDYSLVAAQETEIENCVFGLDGQMMISTRSTVNETGPSQLWQVQPGQPAAAKLVGETEPLGLIVGGGAFGYSLFDHLKTVDLSTGRILQRWPEIKTGRQRGATGYALATPAYALDQETGAIAVAGPSCVFVVSAAA